MFKNQGSHDDLTSRIYCMRDFLMFLYLKKFKCKPRTTFNYWIYIFYSLFLLIYFKSHFVLLEMYDNKLLCQYIYTGNI